MTEEDVVGKHISEIYPDLNLEKSSIMEALTKGVPTANMLQTWTTVKGQTVKSINTTVPIFEEGQVIGAAEVSRYVTGKDDMINIYVTPVVSSENRPMYVLDDIKSQWSGMENIKTIISKVSRTDSSVLIYGKTGTGKELVAEAIHTEGKRRNKRFVAQNCAAIPETLLEGILFGTTKGSFTGAVDRAGLFEQANGGTLLLDEISAMPYDLQSKLLRVLQEGYIRRVGGTKDRPVNVRIISTVNEPPEELIEQGKLRKDLYYRLNVINISIPALRERLDDIPVLTDIFLEKHNKRFGKELWMVTDGAIKKLQHYDYPGNVRELENIIEQAVSMADKEHVLSEKILNMPGAARKARSLQISYDNTQPLDEYLAAEEARIIRDAIMAADGNISRAADSLKIKRQTLQHKLKKYHISGQ